MHLTNRASVVPQFTITENNVRLFYCTAFLYQTAVHCTASTELLYVKPGWYSDEWQFTGRSCIATSHPGQHNLLPTAGLKMSTGQTAVMLWGWEMYTGMAHSMRKLNVYW